MVPWESHGSLGVTILSTYPPLAWPGFLLGERVPERVWPGQGLGVKRWGTGDSDSGKKECTRDETSNLPWELPGLRRARQAVSEGWGGDGRRGGGHQAAG